MRKGYQLVYILQTLLGLGKKYDMICSSRLVVDIALLIYETGIVQQIALHSVYDFDFVACHRSRIGEGLNHAVVCYGYCGVSPFDCLLYNLFGVIETVHGAHFGMKMKLHAPAVLAGVFSFFYFAFFYIPGFNYKDVVVCIPLCHTSDFSKSTRR